MAATVQHADAVNLVEHLEKHILQDPGFHMTYSDDAAVLGRNAASDGRHIGQSTRLAFMRRPPSMLCTAFVRRMVTVSIRNHLEVIFGDPTLRHLSRGLKLTSGFLRISRTSNGHCIVLVTMPQHCYGNESSNSE